jgi:methylthioribose-1-phosphate isomerase
MVSPSTTKEPVLGAFRITGGRSFYESQSVEIIDQLLLPHSIVWETVDTIEGAFDAIKSMKIRGAPAIASLAALGIAAELLALLNSRPSPSFPSSTLTSPPSTLLEALLNRTAYLLTSRPTAVNLREALSRIEAAAKAEVEGGADAEKLAKKVVEVAVGVWEEDKERCEKIGNNGAKWILEKLEREGTIEKGEKIAVLTVRLRSDALYSPLHLLQSSQTLFRPLRIFLQVCNTGSLATSVRPSASLSLLFV